jgi:hypothetical protein
MSLLRISNGFEKLSDADLLTKANSILDSMSGNTNFSNPQPTLATFGTAITDFSTALDAASHGSSLDKAIKNQRREDLINILHALGAYVLFASGGVAVTALSSGFSISKTPQPAPPVQAVTGQRLEDGPNSGTLKYSFDRGPGAKAYIYQCAPDPVTATSDWMTLGGTTRSTLFSGLVVGKKYWCRTGAIGTNGQIVYSEPIWRIVQ